MTTMHTVREDEWNRHCDVVAGVMVRVADAKPSQQSMRLTMEEVSALLYHEQMKAAYFASREAA